MKKNNLKRLTGLVLALVVTVSCGLVALAEDNTEASTELEETSFTSFTAESGAAASTSSAEDEVLTLEMKELEEVPCHTVAVSSQQLIDNLTEAVANETYAELGKTVFVADLGQDETVAMELALEGKYLVLTQKEEDGCTAYLAMDEEGNTVLLSSTNGTQDLFTVVFDENVILDGEADIVEYGVTSEKETLPTQPDITIPDAEVPSAALPDTTIPESTLPETTGPEIADEDTIEEDEKDGITEETTPEDTSTDVVLPEGPTAEGSEESSTESEPEGDTSADEASQEESTDEEDASSSNEESSGNTDSDSENGVTESDNSSNTGADVE